MHIDAAMAGDIKNAFGQDLTIGNDHNQVWGQRLQFCDHLGLTQL